MKTKFAENFAALLKSKNISQSQFAQLYGVKQNTVSQWANGKREPTYHDLLCICSLLNIEIQEILGYTPRTKKAIIRDIIGNSQFFQNEQHELQDKLFKQGYSIDEVVKACEGLYNQHYEKYNKIFHLEE